MSFENIPKEMKEAPRWCLRKDKVPYSVSGRPAKPNDLNTFSSFGEVIEALEGAGNNGYDGIGFLLGGGWIGVDFDHCLDKTAGLDPRVESWVQRFDSYTEKSPSETGLHIITRGLLTGGSVKRDWCELYDKDRYFTVTGNVYGEYRPVRVAQDAISALRQELAPPAEKPAPQLPQRAESSLSPAMADSEILEIAFRAKNGAAIKKLYDGDWSGYKSQSEADIALCNYLAFYTKDAQQLDRLFRSSGLMRDKWDHKHGKETYGEMTVRKAIDLTREGYTPRATAAQDFGGMEKKAGSQIVWAANVPYEPPRWTLAPYFQQGKGTLIQGDSGTGKTAFMCAIAAHITTGTPLLGLPVQSPGNVLMLSVEDDLPILRGRIEACGGDLTKCAFMTNAAGMTFLSPEVEEAIKKYDIKMVIFDPIQAFMGADVDMFRANETRPLLAKLFEMCDRNNCCCAIIAHMGKSGDKSPVNRSLGSVDIPASMRSVMQLLRNPENEDECIMVHVKSSNAPKGQSIAYTIGERGGVHWVGFSPMTVDDLSVAVKRKEKGVPYEQEPLVQVFNQLIADRPGGGFWSYADLKSEGAKILGFPPYGDLADLRSKLDEGLARELQQRDGLIVTHSEKGRANARGIRILQYQHPQGYQQRLTSSITQK